MNFSICVKSVCLRVFVLVEPSLNLYPAMGGVVERS